MEHLTSEEASEKLRLAVKEDNNEKIIEILKMFPDCKDIPDEKVSLWI